MKSYQRAQRRFHRKRLLQKRKGYWRHPGSHAGEQPHNFPKVVHTPKLCSCVLCGNPRKFFGEPTRQEKQAEWAWRESMSLLWET